MPREALGKVLKTKKSMFAHALLFAEREGFEPPEV